MKLLKEILEGDTISKFRVPSKSEKGKYHIVRLLIDNELTCDCIAGSMGRFCRHKKLVAVKLFNKGVKVKLPENVKRN